MQTYFVTGPSCSGKSTFCDRMCEVFHREHSFTIQFCLGEMLRDLLGDQFFVDTYTGPANQLVEQLVRDTILHLLRISNTIGANLVVDGFPRSVDQVDFIVRNRSSFSGTWKTIVLMPSPELLAERVLKRTGTSGADHDLAMKQVRQVDQDFLPIIDALREYRLTHSVITGYDHGQSADLLPKQHSDRESPGEIRDAG